MASLLQRLQGGYKAQSDHKAPLHPKAVLLDVNGTLFDAIAAAPAFTQLGLDPGLVEVSEQLWWLLLLLLVGAVCQVCTWRARRPPQQC